MTTKTSVCICLIFAVPLGGVDIVFPLDRWLIEAPLGRVLVTSKESALAV